MAKKNWLSRVNSAWWALPSGVNGRASLAGSVGGEVRVGHDLRRLHRRVGHVEVDVAAVPVGHQHDVLAADLLDHHVVAEDGVAVRPAGPV